MLGHITLGIAMIEKKIAAIPGFPPRLRMLVEHIVLSHHGKYEFGSPKAAHDAGSDALPLPGRSGREDALRAHANLTAARSRAARPDEMTDWVRSLERPLLDSRAFLDSRGFFGRS